MSVSLLKKNPLINTSWIFFFQIATMASMIRKQKGAVVWLEFELLQEFAHLAHGVFLRHGGVSIPPYYSLNFAASPGDSPQAAFTNREIAANILGLSQLMSASLRHGGRVELVSRSTPPSIAGCDSLVCTEPKLGLLVDHADCQAALFFDPIRNVIANVHSGWRGSVQNIYQNTIDFFHARFGSNPADLLVCISPSLGPDRAEFIHYQRELPPSFLEFQIRPTYFDFWAISHMQLEKAGILPHHIQIAKLCTYQEQDDFFSFRRDKVTGRNGTVIGFKNLARIL